MINPQQRVRDALNFRLSSTIDKQIDIYIEIGISGFTFWKFTKGEDIGRLSLAKISKWLDDKSYEEQQQRKHNRLGIG